MSEILLCNKPMSVNSSNLGCGAEYNPLLLAARQRELKNLSQNCALSPYTPYALCEGEPSRFDKSVVSQLSNPVVTKGLADFSSEFGGDMTVAMAAITSKLNNAGFSLPSTINGTGGLISGRSDKFLDAVDKYQKALIEYRKTIQSKADKVKIKAAKIKINQLHSKLQTQFKLEMNAVEATSKAGTRGTVLSNPDRGINVARSSRSPAKLNVTSQVQASNLVQLGKQAKFLGNGLTAIDFTGRAAGVIQTAGYGGNWERELFAESAGFVAGVSTGIIVAKIGIGILLATTPVGWVLLLGSAVTIAATLASATAVDRLVKNGAGRRHENIVSLVSGGGW